MVHNDSRPPFPSPSCPATFRATQIDGIAFDVYDRLVTATPIEDVPISIWDHEFEALSAPEDCLALDFTQQVAAAADGEQTTVD